MSDATSVPIVTITGAKGGIGKSSLTANIPPCLARFGLRPLVIDLDPQGSLTRFMAHSYAEESLTRLAHLTNREAIEKEIEALKEFALPSERSVLMFFDGKPAQVEEHHGVGLVGFSHQATARQSELGNASVQNRFIQALDDTIANYGPDVVFIDTPPSNLDAAAFAINMATHIVIPLEPSLEGVRGAMIADEQRRSLIDLAKRQKYDRQLELAGVVPSAVLRCNLAKRAVDLARHIFGDLVLSPIDHAVTIKEAATEGLPVIVYEDKLRGLVPKYQLGGHRYHKSGRQYMQVAGELGCRLGLLDMAPDKVDEEETKTAGAAP